MSSLTSTIVKVPKKHLVAFGGVSRIRERWGDNIDDSDLEDLENLEVDELVSFVVYETRDNEMAEELGASFPDCMAVVENREHCYYAGYLWSGGRCVLELSEGYVEEDDDNEDVLDATENRAWEKLKEEWDKPRDTIILDILADEHLDNLRKQASINTVTKAIKCANDASSDSAVAIACMKYVADTGRKHDIEKLIRFYVEETDAGIPEPGSAEFRIVNRGADILFNEIPGNVYDVQESEVKGFSSKGREPSTVCIESDKDYLLTENVCKRRRSHINSPSWLKITDNFLDVLCVDPEKSLSGGIGGWNICKKIICNGKEWPYFIVGHDRRGDMWAPYASMILCAEDPEAAPIIGDVKYFTYSWWDGQGDKMEYVRLMRETGEKDLNKLLNRYDLNSILDGFTLVNGIDRDNLINIKSFILKKDKAVITFIDGEKIEIGIKRS